MKAEKIDRRIRYTTMLIKESLVQLMQTNPISKISVKMICEAADINRSTFYAHYTDQYDLLQKLEKEVVAGFREYVETQTFDGHSETSAHALEQLLEYAAKHADLLKVLLSENGDSDFHRDIVEIAQLKAIADLNRYQSIDSRTIEYMNSFIIAGALSLVLKWLEDGMIESTQEIAKIISKLLFRGMSSFYSSNKP